MRLRNTSNYAFDQRMKAKLKAAGIYAGLFVLWIAVCAISKGLYNGANTPMILFTGGLMMTIVTFAVCQWIPNERHSTLRAYKMNMAGFLFYMLILQGLMFASGSSTAASYLTTLYAFSQYIYPLGYIAWEGKKFAYLMGIGKTRRESIDYYKDHGNDGNM
jgi:hypothetical protein